MGISQIRAKPRPIGFGLSTTIMIRCGMPSHLVKINSPRINHIAYFFLLFNFRGSYIILDLLWPSTPGDPEVVGVYYGLSQASGYLARLYSSANAAPSYPGISASILSSRISTSPFCHEVRAAIAHRSASCRTRNGRGGSA